MNISNLKEGMVIKNYKELCNLLGEKTKTGTSKISQIKDLQRYIRFSRDKYSYIIEEVFNEPKEKLYNYFTPCKPLHESVLFKYIDLEINENLDINMTKDWENISIFVKCKNCNKNYKKLIKSLRNNNKGVCKRCAVSNSKYNYDFEYKIKKVYIEELIKNLKYYNNQLINRNFNTTAELIDFVKLNQFIRTIKIYDYKDIIDISEFYILRSEYDKLLTSRCRELSKVEMEDL